MQSTYHGHFIQFLSYANGRIICTIISVGIHVTLSAYCWSWKNCSVRLREDSSFVECVRELLLGIEWEGLPGVKGPASGHIVAYLVWSAG